MNIRKNNYFKVFFLSILFFFVTSLVFSQEQQIYKANVYSKKMGTDISAIIILPKDYDKNSKKKYCVVYLLNGHGANERTFLGIKPNLPDLATDNQVIFVCPDGKNSWYWDSPINSKSQFDTFISKELVKYVDSHYKTVPNSTGRAITGFSMGGYGALWLTMNHPNVFGAAGSMSGAADIRPFPKNWNMKDYLGEYSLNKSVWDNHTIITQVERLRPVSSKLIIDCGQGDFFLDVNEKLHKLLIDNKINHIYKTSPGTHNFDYWRNAMDPQLDFFFEFFLSANPEAK